MDTIEQRFPYVPMWRKKNIATGKMYASGVSEVVRHTINAIRVMDALPINQGSIVSEDDVVELSGVINIESKYGIGFNYYSKYSKNFDDYITIHISMLMTFNKVEQLVADFLSENPQEDTDNNILTLSPHVRMNLYDLVTDNQEELFLRYIQFDRTKPGTSWLKRFSPVLDFIPVVSQIKGFAEDIRGYELGEEKLPPLLRFNFIQSDTSDSNLYIKDLIKYEKDVQQFFIKYVVPLINRFDTLEKASSIYKKNGLQKEYVWNIFPFSVLISMLSVAYLLNDKGLTIIIDEINQYAAQNYTPKVAMLIEQYSTYLKSRVGAKIP